MIYKFPHPEWFDGVEKPQISSEDTIIYGERESWAVWWLMQ